ncbi:MAG: energy-coupling factor transporter transmembrane component T [Anaerolineales bacterium]|nr:energy-coupling factor transporter transmembrane component T [Anaerolineales bacterium]
MNRKGFSLGTVGHLGIFSWALGMVMLTPGKLILYAAGFCLLVLFLIYPGIWRRLLAGRRLILLALLSVPPVFFLGDVDLSFLGVGFSSTGVQAALQITSRFLVVIGALEGLTANVEIAALAGILERLGLKGLGFSMGVALNIMPCLKRSCTQTWRCLKMRGGLRRKWWRGIRLFALTTISNALLRAEEIALAAESRAFSPEKTRPLPLLVSTWDWVVFPAALVVIVFFVILA